MRSGSAAIAKKGKIDVMPITWKRACARDSEKTAASFALPYGRARKRTRRIKSATLWINGGKAAPSYAFKKRRMILQRREFANYLRVNSGVKAYRILSKVPLWLCRGARPGQKDRPNRASVFPGHLK